MSSKIYHLEEVSKHADPKDLWVVIRGKVYNITEFLDFHPGGEEVLTDVAGQDATSQFIDVGHSDEAEELLEKYYLGELDPSEAKEYKSHDNYLKPSDGEGSGSSSIIYLAIAAILAALAFVYLQALKK